MSIHIGKIIHTLIKERNITAKSVAIAVHVSESNIYKIYKKETIDVSLLFRISIFLNNNLFLHYSEEESFKKLFGGETEQLKKELADIRNALSMKETRILDLEKIISAQDDVIKHIKSS